MRLKETKNLRILICVEKDAYKIISDIATPSVFRNEGLT